MLVNEEREWLRCSGYSVDVCVCACNTRQRERERAKTEFLYIAYFTYLLVTKSVGLSTN